MYPLTLTHCSRETHKIVIGKQCRPRSDTAERASTRHLIRVSTVCKYFSHFSLGICKSHCRTYLKLKLDSSNIKCGRVFPVYNGLIKSRLITDLCPINIFTDFGQIVKMLRLDQSLTIIHFSLNVGTCIFSLIDPVTPQIICAV